MSDPKSKTEAPGGAPTEEAPKHAYIGYCPELKLYRYALSTGQEQRFTDEELVAALAALEADDRIAERDALALVAAMARRQPHLKIKVQDLPASG